MSIFPFNQINTSYLILRIYCSQMRSDRCHSSVHPWPEKQISSYPRNPSWKSLHINTGDLRPDQNCIGPTEKLPVLRYSLWWSVLLFLSGLQSKGPFNRVRYFKPSLYTTLWVWFTIHVMRCHWSGCMSTLEYQENWLSTFHLRCTFDGLVGCLYKSNVFPKVM